MLPRSKCVVRQHITDNEAMVVVLAVAAWKETRDINRLLLVVVLKIVSMANITSTSPHEFHLLLQRLNRDAAIKEHRQQILFLLNMKRKKRNEKDRMTRNAKMHKQRNERRTFPFNGRVVTRVPAVRITSE